MHARVTAPVSDAARRPVWLRKLPQPRRVTLLAALLAAASAPLDILLLWSGAGGAAWTIAALGSACAIVAVLETLRLERERASQVAEAEQLHATTFQQACTSIWIEDWTQVGEAILALREAGTDVQAYLTDHPDVLRRLHGTVLITDVNNATVDFTGVRSKEDLIGRLADVVPASAQTFDRWVAALARGDAFYRSESRVRRQDGSTRDCLVMAPLPAGPEDFGRVLVSVVDITDYKADQARLAAAEREVARSSRALTMGALTAAIAHEVNNPLAAIVTNASASLRWLRRPVPDLAEAEAAISEVIGEALRAREVVDRTRRLVTSGPQVLAELDLSEVIRGVVPLMKRELTVAGASLRVALEPNIPRVRSDAVQVQQVLTNLLMNAVQAMTVTEGPREVTISAYPHPEGARVEVSDTGPGIQPDQLTRLFDPFFSARQDGMGMGLAICKACVEAHGGRIWATSAPGAGATFGFTLPAAGHA